MAGLSKMTQFGLVGLISVIAWETLMERTSGTPTTFDNLLIPLTVVFILLSFFGIFVSPQPSKPTPLRLQEKSSI